MKKEELLSIVMESVAGKNLGDTDLRLYFNDELENASRGDAITPSQARNWFLTDRELPKLRRATKCVAARNELS